MGIREDNRGLSLVELIVTIAIFAVLASIIGVAALGQLEKAKRTTAMTSAENICTAVQTAIVDISATHPDEFNASLKYTKDGESVGVFSSAQMYKYLASGSPISQYDAAPLADKLECYLAEIASNSIANSVNHNMPSNTSVSSVVGSGKSSVELSDVSQYGQIVFAMAYNGKCEIMYFECVYNGYYVKIEGADVMAKGVGNDVGFQTWP